MFRESDSIGFVVEEGAVSPMSPWWAENGEGTYSMLIPGWVKDPYRETNKMEPSCH